MQGFQIDVDLTITPVYAANSIDTVDVSRPALIRMTYTPWFEFPGSGHMGTRAEPMIARAVLYAVDGDQRLVWLPHLYPTELHAAAEMPYWTIQPSESGVPQAFEAYGALAGWKVLGSSLDEDPGGSGFPRSLNRDEFAAGIHLYNRLGRGREHVLPDPIGGLPRGGRAGRTPEEVAGVELTPHELIGRGFSTDPLRGTEEERPPLSLPIRVEGSFPDHEDEDPRVPRPQVP